MTSRRRRQWEIDLLFAGDDIAFHICIIRIFSLPLQRARTDYSLR